MYFMFDIILLQYWSAADQPDSMLYMNKQVILIANQNTKNICKFNCTSNYIILWAVYLWKESFVLEKSFIFYNN